MKRPPTGVEIAAAVAALALAAASTGVAVSQSVQASEAAQQVGHDTAKAAKRLELIKASEARETRRKLAARAQLFGAAGGSPISEASIAQISRDVDRQSALDIWSIRQRGYQSQAETNQQVSGLRAGAASQGLQGGSNLIRSYSGYHNLGIL